MKPALLVIDIQKDFFHESETTAVSLNSAIDAINPMIALFRRKGLPVISIQHMEEENGLLPGAEGFDLPERLEILPEDVHIHKKYGNAFNKTNLAETLREQGVDTPIITGFCAEYCVLSTARGALDLDFTPILLRGAIASSTPANIPFVENCNNLISFQSLYKIVSDM